MKLVKDENMQGHIKIYIIYTHIRNKVKMNLQYYKAKSITLMLRVETGH